MCHRVIAWEGQGPDGHANAPRFTVTLLGVCVREVLAVCAVKDIHVVNEFWRDSKAILELRDKHRKFSRR
jgi:hypothetical protein